MRTEATLFSLAGEPLVTFDVILEERATLEFDEVDHEVEQGADITDHQRLKRPSITLRAEFVRAPLELTTAEQGRELSAYQQLDRLARQSQLITAVIGLTTLTPCTISSLSGSREADGGEWVSCDLTLRQWRIVASSRVLIPERVRRAERDSATEAVDGGEGEGQEPGEEEEERNQSILYRTLINDEGEVDAEAGGEVIREQAQSFFGGAL